MGVLSDKEIARVVRKFSHDKSADRLRSPSAIAEQEVLEFLVEEFTIALDRASGKAFDAGRFRLAALGYREL